jgi:hypothetical protein
LWEAITEPDDSPCGEYPEEHWQEEAWFQCV